MVNAAATAANLPLLEAINSGARMPGYAAGGYIGPPPSGGSTGTPGPGAVGSLSIAIRMEDDGRLVPLIESVSGPIAIQASEALAGTIPDRVRGVLSDRRAG